LARVGAPSRAAKAVPRISANEAVADSIAPPRHRSQVGGRRRSGTSFAVGDEQTEAATTNDFTERTARHAARTFSSGTGSRLS
jgi:hypothetical protein